MSAPSEIARHRYAGKRVTVVGLAREGTSLVRFLVRAGAEIIANDRGSLESLRAVVDSLEGLPVRFVLGGHPPEAFVGAETVFLSPGVPQELEPLAECRKRGVSISSETQLFFELCRGRVAGITGSAGKTTTTALTGEMLRQAGVPAFVGGNIGVPLLERLDEIHEDAWVLLEMSSFQLEALPYSPRLGAILNVTPNHLDRHQTMERYTLAKQNILRHQGPEDWAVLNADDPMTVAMERPGRTKWFSVEGEVNGGYLSGESVIVTRDRLAQVVCDVGEVRLPGRHNLANVVAAVSIASVVGVDAGSMRTSILDFRGVPHRLEKVGEIDGVAYFNDSIATAPERSIASIRSFDRPVVLIAGGRNKRLPLEEWAQVIVERVKALVLMGETAEDIENAVRSAGSGDLPLYRAADMEGAVRLAGMVASRGDTVLLAPGGTSFDMYRDFEARGEDFRRCVALQGARATTEANG